MFGGDRELGEVIEDVARLGARLIIQTALEAEIDAFLGRARYQRSAMAQDARPGMRNGYSPATVKTTAGPVTVARPKLRGTTETFASRLFGTTVTKSNALESLVIAGFVRGLSVRDVENTLADALGAEAALSKSAVSRVCQAIGGQFEAWRTRPLDGVVLDYLFLDASMFKMHPGARPEPVLAAWGIDTGGKPVFVALAAGGSESTDAWGDFLDELAGRGLRPPLLVISDGAAGLINAVDLGAIPRSLPLPQAPMLVLIPSLLIPALSLAFVGLVQGAAISANFPNPDGSYPDASRDFIGQGAANVIAGVFRGMPVVGPCRPRH